MAPHDSDPELVARCMEELAATVLDAGDPMTYRTLGASAHVNVDVSRDALQTFATENADSVGALQVVVQRGTMDAPADASSHKTTEVDPRARVIRIGSFSPASSDEKVLSKQIYSVYKKSANGDADASTNTVPVEPLSIACWSHERSLRNDIFQKLDRHAPLSLAVRAFYASGIACAEATMRAGVGDHQGEESVSVFDAVHAAKKPAVAVKSFFKSSSSSSATAAKASTVKATPAKSQQQQRPETKKIDAKSMSNVFTIDSDDDDDDDDSDDGDAPAFVKKTPANRISNATKPRSKRVISDDDDDDDDEDDNNDVAAKPPVKPAARTAISSSSRNVKRKLSDSPAVKSRTESPADKEDADAKKPHDEDVDEDVEMLATAGPTTRRIEMTKTRINEQGYMVTEKTYEEVELTAAEVEQERIAAVKKKKAAAAARAAAEAKAAAAEKKAKSSSSTGPAKQKNLFAFFSKK